MPVWKCRQKASTLRHCLKFTGNRQQSPAESNNGFKTMHSSDNCSEYRDYGATVIRGLLAREVVDAISYQMSMLVRSSGRQMLAPPTIGNKPCFEAYCYQTPVLLTLLWGMTPRIEQLTGCSLLPTYSYFRTYQRGDLCRIHCDRPACEHSLSLTLAYADGREWALEVGRSVVPPEFRGTEKGDDDFGDDEHVAFPMQPGDAVLYRGVEFMHGRTAVNPNRWSAHLFMHWVDRNGPFADQAFDSQNVAGPTDFVFPASV